MTDNRLLNLVDARNFRTLFIDELGWNNPDRPDLTIEVDDGTFTLRQVAGFKGLRIWHCPVLPSRKTQRQIDVLIGKDNQERLVIFTSEQRQEWRWPRRAQLGSANAKLLVHQHLVGDHNTHLIQRLQAIELDFDEDLSLVALLEKMRDAFDHEAESASVAAARLMGTLYTELETAGVREHDATLLLARLLFLLFGDDTDMWKPEYLFQSYMQNHTTAETLHTDLLKLFTVVDTDTEKRTLPADSPYAQFPYINGGLFRDSLRLPRLTSPFRDALIDACEFDWSIISPAVFGSMFQTVKSKEARRAGGEHYTTEENILKTIRPLFLDEYRGRLERAWDDKAQLTKLHNELGRLQFLDPACGCGNFLIVAYRELRSLELELLKRRRDLDLQGNTHIRSSGVDRAQLTLDVTGDIKVTLDHFYGIEIEEWPARIAETAMLLVDHLANQRMAQEFGESPDRLPITIAPIIHHGDSLEVDWNEICPQSDHLMIMGNPPYLGPRMQSTRQRKNQNNIWAGVRGGGTLDYVSNWLLKAARHLQGTSGRAAFVTTNSITQGGQPAVIWDTMHRVGVKIDFARRTFNWENGGAKQAAVHCVIIGFSSDRHRSAKRLWMEEEFGGVVKLVDNINPFLLDAPDVYIWSRATPLVDWAPPMSVGNEPRDGGYLSKLSGDDVDHIRSQDPIAVKYLRRLVGADEHLNNRVRYCLWLEEASPEEISQSPELRRRVAAVQSERLGAKGAKGRAANRPWAFGAIFQPKGRYLLVPSVSSKNRDYIPMSFYDKNVIINNSVFFIESASMVIFGVLQSKIFTNWVSLVSSRMKSDFQISTGSVYNTFPWPDLNDDMRQRISSAALLVTEVRERYPEKKLSNLYDRELMPRDLIDAHDKLDSAVMEAYKLDSSATDLHISTALFERYSVLTTDS